jgi:hypothetical protein
MARSSMRRRSLFSGTKVLATNVAPYGSPMTVIRTQGASNGGKITFRRARRPSRPWHRCRRPRRSRRSSRAGARGRRRRRPQPGVSPRRGRPLAPDRPTTSGWRHTAVEPGPSRPAAGSGPPCVSWLTTTVRHLIGTWDPARWINGSTTQARRCTRLAPESHAIRVARQDAPFQGTSRSITTASKHAVLLLPTARGARTDSRASRLRDAWSSSQALVTLSPLRPAFLSRSTSVGHV